MTENPDAKYCALCEKKIIIGEFADLEHQQFNLFAHILGEPMLCRDCWRKCKRGDKE